MIKYLSVTLLMLMTGFYSLCYSQSWVRTYHGPFLGDASAINEAHSLALGSEGNVYVAGFSTDSAANTDMCIIKYDQNGDITWSKYHNGTGNGEDKAYAITVDPCGLDAFITGYTTEIGDHVAITTIKYDYSSGNEIWTQTLPDTTLVDSKAYAITLDAYGCVIVAGYCTNQNQEKKMIVIRYDTSGQISWAYPYGGINSSVNALAVDKSDNSIIITGYSSSTSSPGSEDYLTIKLDSAGTVLWSKAYNGPGEGTDIADAIAIDNLSNIYISGSSTGDQSGLDYCTIKYSPSGSQKWVARYNGIGNSDDSVSSIALAGNNNVIVTGYSKSDTLAGTEDYVTIKYDESGTQVWLKRFDGSGTHSDKAYSLAVSPSGNEVFVTGASEHGSTEETQDMVTIKYDIASGDQIDSAMVYNGVANDEDVAYAVKVDSSNNLYITGVTVGGGDRPHMVSDILTMKFQFKKSKAIENVPNLYKLYQNYPNPFNPTTTIKFDIGKASNVKLVIYDILGRQVAVPVDKFCTPGNYEIKYNMVNLASGIYFYQLTTGSFRDVKKMILMK